jgi:hypothetical protein
MNLETTKGQISDGKSARTVFLRLRFQELLQERHLILKSVHFGLQVVDFVADDHKTDHDYRRKDCDHSPHRASGVWNAWPLHRSLLGLGLRAGGE